MSSQAEYCFEVSFNETTHLFGENSVLDLESDLELSEDQYWTDTDLSLDCSWSEDDDISDDILWTNSACSPNSSTHLLAQALLNLAKRIEGESPSPNSSVQNDLPQAEPQSLALEDLENSFGQLNVQQEK